jgi:tRNA threonylcarbamoyl adenosine modification protein YeaZ
MTNDGICLAIETSNPGSSEEDHGSVALGRWSKGALVDELGSRWLPKTQRLDVSLFPVIDALLGECDVTRADLVVVAVSQGPGGYTSVRIGVAAACAIAASLQINCIGVPTSTIAVTKARARGVVLPDVPLAVALSGKKESAWYAIADANECDARCVGVCDSESCLALLQETNADVRTVLADEHLPTSHRAVFHTNEWTLDPIILDASTCLQAASGRTPVDPSLVQPIYPREPEAVKLWRERK